MKSSAKTIGANIRILRTEQNMTQDALAEALFVTRQTVSNYETGRSYPDIDKLLAIAEVLGTDINTLIYGKLPAPDREAERKRLIRSVCVTAIILMVSLLLRAAVDVIEDRLLFFHSAGQIYKLIVSPVVWSRIGYTLVELLSYYFGIRPAPEHTAKSARMILWGFAALYFVTILPMVGFIVTGVVHSALYDSVSLHFPYIPVYTELYLICQTLSFRYSFFYTLFGGALRLFRKETKPEADPE